MLLHSILPCTVDLATISAWMMMIATNHSLLVNFPSACLALTIDLIRYVPPDLSI